MPRQSGMSALEKEWKAIEKREQRLAKLALQGKDSAWKGKLEEKVPPKVSRAEASLTKGSGWLERNQAVDQIMAGSVVPDQEALKRQRDRTAQTFAMDMLLLKFVQGLPLVGVLGGVGNPVYYRRVLRYVALKYRKRYLFQKREELAE